MGVIFSVLLLTFGGMISMICTSRRIRGSGFCLFAQQTLLFLLCHKCYNWLSQSASEFMMPSKQTALCAFLGKKRKPGGHGKNTDGCSFERFDGI